MDNMHITFLTLNIWKGGMLFDTIISFVHRENPDIITLQEVYNGSQSYMGKRLRAYTELQKELSMPYAHFAPTFYNVINNEKIDQGNAIFSKFPIISSDTTFFDIPYGPTEHIPYDHYPRNIQHACIALPQKNVDVYNVHGIWGEKGEDTERRLAMGDVISQHIKDKEYALLAGDFNMNPNTQTIKKIEKYMQSVFGTTLTTTFNMKHKESPGYATSAVDMMFVTPNINVIKHYMPQVDVSDHMPLVSVLEI
jgi:endonuclease/exonuclease/phosphatase family metal-dependent hydrolase